MKAKEYLSRAYKLDRQIDSKLEQVRSLRELAEKTNSMLSHEPKSGNRNIQPMEATLVKMMDLEAELARKMEELLDLKHEIGDVIDAVPDTDCRLLLEYSYISLKSWEELCSLINYSWPQTHRLYKKSLEFVNMILNEIELYMPLLIIL